MKKIFNEAAFIFYQFSYQFIFYQFILLIFLKS